jgi:hypothetical protein
MGARELIRSLPKNIANVDLAGNRLGAVGSLTINESILDSKSYNKLRTLSLENTGLGDRGAIKVLNGLHRNSTVARLNLARN